MRDYIYIYNKVRDVLWTMTLIMGLCSLFMVTACSSDDVVEEERQPSDTLHLLSCSTRAGDETSTFAEGANLWLALTQGTSGPAEGATGTYIYSTSTSEWTSSSPVIIPETEQYYLYGVYSKTAVTCTIAPSTDYATGALLTISGIKPVVAGDDEPLVVVGVQGVPNASTEWAVSEGSFAYTGVKKSNQDNVHLLLDHLYASFSFSFDIDSKYALLRTIKLKKLEIKTAATICDNVKLTVTLAGNSTATSPITSVTAERVGSGTETRTLELYNNTDGKDITTLTTTEMNGLCFAVFDELGDDKFSSFTLRSTYDVYDKEGNLIGERTADNALDVYALYGSTAKPAHGIRKPVKLMVNPTYLYILSDPDLDNPTITVES